MMNDRFSIQLRRHLLEAADERPADGQLKAVVQRTAVEPQRRPWVVRLRWLLDPVAPFGSVGLRYGLVALALLIAAAMVAILAGGPRPGGGSVFEGRWTSTDPVDASTQTLVVEGGQTPNVHLEDDFSINCERRGDSSTAYVADGPGEILRDRLIARFLSEGCVIRLGPYEAYYDYDSATDTLLDYQRITWVRAPP